MDTRTGRPPFFSLQGIRVRLPWRRQPAPPRTEVTLLAEVAGALVHQLTVAQAQADHASAQVGEAYRQHPTLARFPVPSLHLHDVEITLPVALAGLHAEGATDGGPDAEADGAPSGLQVLYTPAQLQGVAPEHIATIKLTLRSQPKRLANVDGRTVLLP